MRKLRLPFRLKVPERDELIAFGLATLAVGLMIGLAIGPIVSGSATVFTLVVPGAPAVPEEVAEPQTASTPALGSPAGSEILASSQPQNDPVPVSAPAPAPAAPVPVQAGPGPAPEPYNDPAPKPPPPDADPAPKPEGVPVEGTVLASAPSSRTYWLSSGGELTTIFAATVPDPGLIISTHVLPLSNGTLAESASRGAIDISKQAKVKAVVSYLDSEAGVAVLSGRGASLPVFAADSGMLDEVAVGERVEAGLDLNVPDPRNYNDAEAGVNPEDLPIRLGEVRRLGDTAPVELTGSLVAIDEESGSLSLSADSTDSLGSVVELLTPEEFPFELVKAGRRYSVTATGTDQGLRVLGLSPASGKAAANDPARAFGTHAG